MREIKFRVYVESVLPEESGVYEPEFISGFSHTLGIDKVYTKDFKFKSDTCKFTLLQYTGLKDKNGVEIYESDLVAIDMWQGNEHGYIAEDGVIKWHQESAAFKWFSLEEDISDGNNYWLSQADKKQREVIGNIYENPKLIGGSDE